MKTTTLTIRLSAADKDLLQTAARGRGLTVTEYLVQLLHADAGPGQTATGDLRAEMDQLTSDLKELRDQVAALDPQRIGREIKELRRMVEVAEGQTAPATKRPGASTSYEASHGPDCNKSCRWFAIATHRCTHPDFSGPNLTIIPDECPNWEPARDE